MVVLVRCIVEQSAGMYKHQLEGVVNSHSGKWQGVGCAGSSTPRGSRTR